MNAPFTFANFPPGNFPAADWDESWAFSNAIGNIACSAAGANAIALTPLATSPTVPAYQQLAKFTFIAAANNTGPVTIKVGSLTALAAYDSTGTQISQAGEIAVNQYYEAVYDSALNSSAGGFHVTSQQAIVAPSSTYTLVTAAGSYTVLAGDNIILMDKTVGAATSILLPLSSSRTAPVTVKDYKGDANTHNITFTPQSGETIDGFSAAAAAANGSALITINYGKKSMYPLLSGGWYIL